MGVTLDQSLSTFARSDIYTFRTHG
uniref:Uncharacterized protein n=1 Tax=Arundo donax TaxID=35708 RepID=A0A0A9A492_ARUDO